MKEIIYLDTEIINSMLAQLDEGIVNNFTLESSSQETQGEETQSTSGKNASISARLKLSTGIFPGGSATFGGTSGDNGIESEKLSTTMLEGQKDILNKAFHDYSLDLLIANLEANNLINSNENYSEGKIYTIISDFKIFDFELIKRASNTKLLREFFFISENKTDLSLEEAEVIVKTNKATPEDKAKAAQAIGTNRAIRSSINNYKKSEIFGILGDNLLENTTIIKSNNIIALANKEYLRTSSTVLALTNSSRKAKILFRVISQKSELFIEENINQIESDHFRLLPTVMLDIILSSLDIISLNDVIVAPIAIYYE